MIKENNLPKNKSIIINGFMGVGKTTIAKLLAEKLDWEFIDIDKEIEKSFNLPVTEIFKQHGEAIFRQKEKETIFHYSKATNKVISLGGGAFLQEDIKKTCLDHGTVISLDISWNTWQERLPLLIDSRPILQNKSIETIKSLFEERQVLYKSYDYKVQTDNRSPEEIVTEIIDFLH